MFTQRLNCMSSANSIKTNNVDLSERSYTNERNFKEEMYFKSDINRRTGL